MSTNIARQNIAVIHPQRLVATSHLQLTTFTSPPIVADPPLDRNANKKYEIMLMTIFNDLCPAVIAPDEKCKVHGCTRSHSPPTALEVEQQLYKATITESEEAYAFFITFPQRLRVEIIPAFINVFINRQQSEIIKQLVLDCHKLRIDKNDAIAAALVQKGSTLLEALQLINSAYLNTSS
jgi:hypothetical protein